MLSERLSEETVSELNKIRGQLMAKDGKNRTFDETIMELIKFWKEKHL